MNDTDLKLRITQVFEALVKGQYILYTQKIKNNVGFYDDPDYK